MRPAHLLLPLLLAAAPLSAQAPVCSAAALTTKVGTDSVRFSGSKVTLFYRFTNPLRVTCTGGVADSSALLATRDTLTTVRAALKAATDSLAKWPSTSPAPTPSPTPTPVPAPSGALTLTNRPSSYTHLSELDFSQQVPGPPDNVDRPIPGAPVGWNMIYFGNSWTSSGGVFTGTLKAGSYGGGVVGQGSGYGIGNVFNNAINGTKHLYAAMRVYFDFDAAGWHPISNKFVNIETDNGLILVQLNEGGQWRHAEFLSATTGSFWVDPGSGTAGQVSNIPVPTRRWVTLEVLVDVATGVFRVWQDGVLTTDAKRPFTGVTKIYGIGWNAFWGGGGRTEPVDRSYKYDHFAIAW
jgi:hypothetical protein